MEAIDNEIVVWLHLYGHRHIFRSLKERVVDDDVEIHAPPHASAAAASLVG